eukprot:TRINITY_DN619_c0_g2_i1.p1 TRINITY_DN619_c0_g2~~TRINITY_DN619_c0_g2_i1.p1  ORF type:complete len:1013 (-),score=185.85 TRINITY_DN619_c0_g2_i1:47-3085(-)
MMNSSLSSASNPLTYNDLPNLVQVLTQAMDPTPSIRKPAEEMLVQLETRPLVCSLLYEIIANKSIDPNVRLMAVVCFKNLAHKFWRTRAPGAVSEEEKDAIRPKLLLLLNEERYQLALQISILLGRIARHDYPHSWPDLLTKLLSLINQDAQPTQRYCGLLALHHVVSSLGSRRLPGNLRQLQESSANIFTIIFNLWSQANVHIFTQLSTLTNNPNASSSIDFHQLSSIAELVKLCLKIFRRLIIHGFPSFHQTPEITNFLNLALERLANSVACRLALPHHPLSKFIDYSIILYNKLFIKIQGAQPLSYIPLLSQSLEFFYQQVISLPQLQQQGKEPLERALIQSMTFLRNVLTCNTYKPDSEEILGATVGGRSNANVTHSPTKDAANIIGSFFNESRLTTLTHTLIGTYFIMTPAELSEWEHDPEDFLHEQETDSWKDKKKSCAETFFSSLLSTYSELITPVMVQILQHVMQPGKENDGNHILLKEACYNSLGLGYYELFNAVDFPNLLSNVLSKEVTITDPRYKIIRRRIAWLIGYWVGKLPQTLRNMTYYLLLTLAQENDLVLSLTALDSLKAVIDDVNFSVEGYREFLSLTVNLTLNFLVGGRVHEADTKLKILNFLAVLLEQVGKEIRPQTTNILTALSNLWKDAQTQNHNMIKSSIVRALTQLVNALGQDPSEFYNILIPVIQYSTDISGPEEVYLLEDGLGLWLQVLQRAPTAHPDLIDLYPNITRILSNSLEYVEFGLKIIDTYLLFGQAQFLAVHSSSLVSTLVQILADIKESWKSLVLKPGHTLLQMFPGEGPQALSPLLMELLRQILSKAEAERIVVAYFSLLARTALVNLPYFLTLFNQLSQTLTSTSHHMYTSQSLLASYIEIWLDKVDHIGESEQRKLTALALCNLLPICVSSGTSDLVSQIPIMITVIVGIIPEADESHDPTLSYDLSYDEVVGRSAVEIKTHEILVNDPVLKMDLRNALIVKAQECESLGHAFQQSMSSLDPIILRTPQTPPSPTN